MMNGKKHLSLAKLPDKLARAFDQIRLPMLSGKFATTSSIVLRHVMVSNLPPPDMPHTLNKPFADDGPSGEP